MSKHKSRNGPTWKDINSEKNVNVNEIRQKNNVLYKELKKLGWTHWDSCNILYEGYTITCRKTFPELQHGYLHFSWVWDNQGGPEFWMGHLYGFYNYKPEEKYIHPHGMFEIRDVTQSTLNLLPQLEQRVVAALNSQSVL